MSDQREGGGRRDRSGDRRAARPRTHGRTPASRGPERRSEGRGRAPARGGDGDRGRERYDGPPIPDDITGRELDRPVMAQLRGLPEKLALRVARHLVAAGRLIDEDPEAAYQHALAARARAARLAVVREAAGEAAYAAGHYAEALTELRAASRMTGSKEHLAVMADCERAVGRPERALTLARSPSVAALSKDQRVEMLIVEAGARRDLGEPEAAVRVLESGPVRSPSREPWLVRLRYAYADALLAADRPGDALEWFHRTVAADGAGLTDAAERAAELESGT